jgi:hypothetical protein
MRTAIERNDPGTVNRFRHDDHVPRTLDDLQIGIVDRRQQRRDIGAPREAALEIRPVLRARRRDCPFARRDRPPASVPPASGEGCAHYAGRRSTTCVSPTHPSTSRSARSHRRNGCCPRLAEERVTRCFSNAAASSGVKNSFPANSAGRSRGVNVAFVQFPCRSGWPSGVRAGVQVDFDTGFAGTAAADGA